MIDHSSRLLNNCHCFSSIGSWASQIKMGLFLFHFCLGVLINFTIRNLRNIYTGTELDWSILDMIFKSMLITKLTTFFGKLTKENRNSNEAALVHYTRSLISLILRSAVIVFSSAVVDVTADYFTKIGLGILGCESCVVLLLTFLKLGFVALMIWTKINTQKEETNELSTFSLINKNIN